MLNNSKLQKILDQIHQALGSDEATGKLTPFFRETLNIDHTNSRAQTFDEVMIVEDILLDPFDINTWNSTIDGLMFSSPIKRSQKAEYYMLSQMTNVVDITMSAPAAAAMFLQKKQLKDPNNQKAIEIFKAQLDQSSNSQTGYLLINPVFFWKIVEDQLPDSIVPSATNPLFIQFVERYINELMLHEVNHHINGHTILQTNSYSPLKPELQSQYASHDFALGAFKASSPHDLANIIEDFAINDYLTHTMNWPTSKDSLFVTGVSSIDPAIDMGPHGISKQPSASTSELTDIDTSVFERIQKFTDSDINILDQSQNSQDNNEGTSSDSNQSDPSTLKQILDELTSSVDNNSDSDAHSASEGQSDIDKEIAQSQLSNAIKNAEESTGSQPGMQGADYNRALNPGTKAKALPKLSIKLTKIRKAFNNSYHVNWSMPHQILTNRLDLHRIEKDPQNSHIDVWIDTSGSMAEDELTRLMTLIIANYVVSAKKTPIIIHPVSYGAVGDEIPMSSSKDISKLKSVGLASNGGTDFHDVLAELQPGAHIIMSDFEWSTTDVTDNIATLSSKDKKILWINTSDSSYSQDVVDAIKSTNQILINLSDYEY